MDRTVREAALLQRAPFVVVELDAARRIAGWNAAAAGLLGLNDGDIGAAAGTRLAAEDAGFWDGLRAGAGPRVGRFAGSRTIEWTAVAGDDEGLWCYGRDVGEQVAREARARLEGTMLRAITENLDIIVWSMERDGLCTYHEGKGLAAIGMGPGAFVGMNIREMYRSLDSTPLDRVFEGKLEFAHTEVHGACFENWMIPMRGASGEVELLVAVSLVVTEQRHAERALRDKLAEIEAQQRTIRELSTPIVEVWDRVLTLPILGIVDASRAAEIMDNLLQAVTRTRARFAILDLTGVKEIDTATASHLLGMVRAIRLLGAEGVVTGIHPSIAETIVNLGIELSNLTVRASLREALKLCITRMSAGARAGGGSPGSA